MLCLLTPVRRIMRRTVAGALDRRSRVVAPPPVMAVGVEIGAAAAAPPVFTRRLLGLEESDLHRMKYASGSWIG